jgi:hypothetical protein
MEHRLG